MLSETERELFRLIAAGGPELVQQLLEDHENDININAKNESGLTPLMQAVSYKQVEIMKIILKYKPDLYIQDTDGRDVTFYVSNCKKPDVKAAMQQLLTDPSCVSELDVKHIDKIAFLEGQLSYEQLNNKEERRSNAQQKMELSLQEKGFIDAFEECMRAKYYVCEALVNMEVARRRDSMDTAGQLLKDLEPAVMAKMQLSTWGLLGISAANLIVSYFTKIRDANEQMQAANFVNMFKKSDWIDRELLGEVANQMMLRFRDQINQLTVSTRDDGREITLHTGDGVVILARRIATRITLHIMRGKDKTYRHGIADRLLDPLERCVKASYACIDDGLQGNDAENEYLPRLTVFEQKDNHRWKVVDLLERAGIKVPQEPSIYYTHTTSLHSFYGFCNAKEGEAKTRGYNCNPNVHDIFYGQHRRVLSTAPIALRFVGRTNNMDENDVNFSWAKIAAATTIINAGILYVYRKKVNQVPPLSSTTNEQANKLQLSKL